MNVWSWMSIGNKKIFRFWFDSQAGHLRILLLSAYFYQLAPTISSLEVVISWFLLNFMF